MNFKTLFIVTLFIQVVAIALAQRDNCNAVEWGSPKRLLCVCNEYYCGDLQLSFPEKKGQVYVYETSESGKRFKLRDLDEKLMLINGSNPESKITVDIKKEFQIIEGWGGAFTDSFGENVKSLPEELQTKLLESYFGPKGLQYNYGRVTIAGSDFSPRKYTYDDLGMPDHELKYWALAREDREYKIPLIKEAMRITKNRGVDLRLFATPWSAPAWMKTNNKLVRGHLIDDDKTYKAYAEYLMKFYDAYKRHGITFWGATVQNEPMAANLPFYVLNSMQMSSAEMIKFIRDYLGPALEARGYTKDNFKLMVGDDSLGFINSLVREVLEDEGVQKYVSGFAFHWYTSGPIVSYNKLDKLYDDIKDKVDFVMMSEACEGSMPMHRKVKPGSWYRAESYSSDIIEDLNRNTNAWVDWNMALDMRGGPNWAGNYVDSPILVDAKLKQFYKQPMYYALAHFTRFFKPGSIRVETKHKDSMFASSVKTVAVYNKQSHHLIINILNVSDRKKTLHINVVGLEGANDGTSLNDFTIDKKSIATLIMKI